MSQMSKTSATMVYKDLAVCVFRKIELHLRQVGKDQKMAREWKCLIQEKI